MSGALLWPPNPWRDSHKHLKPPIYMHVHCTCRTTTHACVRPLSPPTVNPHTSIPTSSHVHVQVTCRAICTVATCSSPYCTCNVPHMPRWLMPEKYKASIETIESASCNGRHLHLNICTCMCIGWDILVAPFIGFIEDIATLQKQLFGKRKSLVSYLHCCYLFVTILYMQCATHATMIDAREVQGIHWNNRECIVQWETPPLKYLYMYVHWLGYLGGSVHWIHWGYCHFAKTIIWKEEVTSDVVHALCVCMCVCVCVCVCLCVCVCVCVCIHIHVCLYMYLYISTFLCTSTAIIHKELMCVGSLWVGIGALHMHVTYVLWSYMYSDVQLAITCVMWYEHCTQASYQMSLPLQEVCTFTIIVHIRRSLFFWCCWYFSNSINIMCQYTTHAHISGQPSRQPWKTSSNWKGSNKWAEQVGKTCSVLNKNARHKSPDITKGNE